MARLVLLTGTNAGRGIPVARPVILGSGPRSPVPIAAGGVSPEHARVWQAGDSVHVADMNSATGTFVNGERVTRATLRSGDELRIGEARLRFEATLSSAPPDTPPPDLEEITLDGPDDDIPAPAPSQLPPAPPRQANRGGRPAAEGAGGIRVAGDRLIQRSPHARAAKRSSLLGQDLSQRSLGFRIVAVLVLLGAAAGLFALVWTLVRST